jgi:putative membrane protein
MKLAASVALALLAFAPVSASAMSASTFHQKAASGDVFEIKSAQLALQKSNNPAVRNFANRLIGDHRQAEQALNQGGGPVVAGPSMGQDEQNMLNQLKNASGKNFDRKFKQLQIQAHQKAIGMYRSFADDHGDQPLGKVAQQTLPQLKKHLAAAQQINLR